MFAQPWAWLGLAGLAVPIAIHMLARQQAVRTLFPSLRFIEATEATFIKRQRLTDLPLLFVRLAMIAFAVAAIAGPRWGSAANGAGPLARAVVVDVSAGIAGSEGIGAARAAAQSASMSTIVDAESLRSGIRSAVAWLVDQPGQRELVVVSDFQRGAIDAADVAEVPVGVGLRFQALPKVPLTGPAGFELRGDRSRMTWPVNGLGAPLPLAVQAGPAQARANAMLSAVASLAVTSTVDATARHATLVFPLAPERSTVMGSGTLIDQPWMFAVVEPLLKDSEMRSRVTAQSVRGELMVVVDAEPDSVLAATVASTVLASLVQPLPWSELEPATIPAEQLRAWERAPSASPAINSSEPQGRWLWLVVLLLIGVETWMRRHRAAAASPVEAHARVA